MDNPVQTEIENYIAASRIRTTRRRIRDARTQFEKQLRSLHREEKRMSEIWYKRGYVPLEPPVMIGYKRFFVLRDDVARSRHADFYEGLLTKINTCDYSHRKDFKVKKRSHGRKHWVLREQQLLQPDLQAFAKLKLTEKEAACFEERFFFFKNSPEPQKRMVFKESWRFILRVRPNMVTVARMELPELKSQMQQLDDYVKRFCLEHKILKVIYSRVYSCHTWDTVEKKHYIKKRTLQQMLQEEWYDKI